MTRSVCFFFLDLDKSIKVPILYHILTKASVAARPSVLWCYKKDLGFTTHRKKRVKELKRRQAVSNTTTNVISL